MQIPAWALIVVLIIGACLGAVAVVVKEGQINLGTKPEFECICSCNDDAAHLEIRPKKAENIVFAE